MWVYIYGIHILYTLPGPISKSAWKSRMDWEPPLANENAGRSTLENYTN